MSMANIYWFTGQPAHGKTVLAKKLVAHLQSTSDHPVLHLDGDDLRELTVNKDYSPEGRVNNIRNAQMIAEFCHRNDCDVVVSLVAPYKWLREEFKQRIGLEQFHEFYVHTTEPRERDHFHTPDYDPPTEHFFDVDTTEDTPDESFEKILQSL